MFDNEKEVQVPVEDSIVDKNSEQIDESKENENTEKPAQATIRMIGLKETELGEEFGEDHPFRKPKLGNTFGIVANTFKDVEMLFEPSDEIESGDFMEEIYKDSINAAIQNQSFDTAMKVASVGMQLLKKYDNKPFVIVSLNPENAWVGIMLKRFFFTKFRMSCPHFCVGLVDGSIDTNALKFIYEKYNKIVPAGMQFVAYTSGDGKLSDMLTQALAAAEEDNSDERYTVLFDEVNDDIAYICDPYGCGEIYADRFDVPCIFDIVGYFGNGTVGNKVTVHSDEDKAAGKFFKGQNIALMKKPEDIPGLPEEYKDADKIIGDLTPVIYSALTSCLDKVDAQVIPLFEQNKLRSEVNFKFEDIKTLIKHGNLGVRYENWDRLILDADSFIVWIETANDQLILLHIN